MKRIVTTIAVILVALLGNLVIASPAPAAPGCYASTCTGKDPNQMGCTATTIWSTGKAGTEGYMELRKSVNCWAAWVRYTGASSAWTGGVEGYTTQYGGGYPSALEIAPLGDGTHLVTRWSNMIDFEYWTQVCPWHEYGGQLLQEGVCSDRF